MKDYWDDYGESSLTIVAVLLKIKKAKPAIPYDPTDFKRCVHLFECLGYNKFLMLHTIEIVSNIYVIWKPFYLEWENLMQCYEEEKNLKSAPKLYELLIKCREKNDNPHRNK
jgi:hypothetical protein